MATSDLKIKLFADGADKAAMLSLYRNPLIKGFTTNPTLMRKAGIADYQAFARDILSEIRDRPISLEVFADDFEEIGQSGRHWSRDEILEHLAFALGALGGHLGATEVYAYGPQYGTGAAVVRLL